jgi:small subunit ribosomal protein S29
VMHFAGRQGWYVVHLPWAAAYNRYYSDYQMSTYKPGRVDQTTDSAEWLMYFRRMNEPLLAPKSEAAEPPRTVERYVWNKREAMEVGTPLTELIEYGVTRVKHASDVMGAVMKELRLQATAGRLRMLVAVDGLNAFWQMTTIKQEDARHLRYSSTDLTMTQHWMRLLRDDWTGGAVVATLDSVASHPIDLDRYTPVELLGSDGFQVIDPFIPIAVPVYSEREAFSCIEYFRDRRWIQSAHGATEDGRRELMALSGNHPHELYRVAINW